MRSPDEIAADLDHWANGYSRLLGEQLTVVIREGAEALRREAYLHDLDHKLADKAEQERDGRHKAEAERDALIAYVRTISPEYIDLAHYVALPPGVRQRIEEEQ